MCRLRSQPADNGSSPSLRVTPTVSCSPLAPTRSGSPGGSTSRAGRVARRDWTLTASPSAPVSHCGRHTDVATARDPIRGLLTTHARFSVMHGNASGPVSDSDRAVLEDLRSSYDMHGRIPEGELAPCVRFDQAFIDCFAIAGTPEHCISRLQRLAALGLDKVALSGSMRGVSETEADVAKRLFEAEVLPAVHSGRP